MKSYPTNGAGHRQATTIRTGSVARKSTRQSALDSCLTPLTDHALLASSSDQTDWGRKSRCRKLKFCPDRRQLGSWKLATNGVRGDHSGAPSRRHFLHRELRPSSEWRVIRSEPVGSLPRTARKYAKALGVDFSFLFMRAHGQQMSEISSLIESGVIRPVVDQVFPFEKTGDALAYVETGRAKGKVVITIAE